MEPTMSANLAFVQRLVVAIAEEQCMGNAATSLRARRAELARMCQAFFLEDAEGALSFGVHALLWDGVAKSALRAFRVALPACRGSPRVVSRADQELAEILREAVSHYERVLSSLAAQRDGDFVPAAEREDALPRMPTAAAVRGEDVPSRHRLAHHVLCALGDLHRHLASRSRARDFADARCYYIRAARLIPAFGGAFNALALTLHQDGALFASLYFYLRGAAAHCASASPTALRNLQALAVLAGRPKRRVDNDLETISAHVFASCLGAHLQLGAATEGRSKDAFGHEVENLRQLLSTCGGATGDIWQLFAVRLAAVCIFALDRGEVDLTLSGKVSDLVLDVLSSLARGPVLPLEAIYVVVSWLSGLASTAAALVKAVCCVLTPALLSVELLLGAGGADALDLGGTLRVERELCGFLGLFEMSYAGIDEPPLGNAIPHAALLHRLQRSIFALRAAGALPAGAAPSSVTCDTLLDTDALACSGTPKADAGVAGDGGACTKRSEASGSEALAAAVAAETDRDTASEAPTEVVTQSEASGEEEQEGDTDRFAAAQPATPGLAETSQIVRKAELAELVEVASPAKRPRIWSRRASESSSGDASACMSPASLCDWPQNSLAVCGELTTDHKISLASSSEIHATFVSSSSGGRMCSSMGTTSSVRQLRFGYG